MIVFIIDKHPLMRDFLAALLYCQDLDLKVVELDNIGSVSSAILKHGLPQLISLELNLSDTIVLSGVEHLKASYPNTALIVLSEYPAKIMASPSLKAGADCYIEKSTPSAKVIAIFKNQLVGDAARTHRLYRPSKRLLEILRLAEKGLSNKSIADTLGILPPTVKNHLTRYYKLIHVKNRSQAVIYARENGFFPFH